jgi:DHA1 family tetracycline resistance protein-like MFS transporter
VIYSLHTFVFAAFTTVFPLWIGYRLGYDAQHAGYLLAYLGLLMAIVQGRLVGPMARSLGERRLLVTGTLTLVAAYALLPLAGGLILLCGVLVPVAVGSGLNWPTATSLASQYTADDRQGAVLGVMQSLSALGRTFGAAWAGWVFGRWTPASPFALNSAIMCLAAAFALVLMIKAPKPSVAKPEPVVRASV